MTSTRGSNGESRRWAGGTVAALLYLLLACVSTTRGSPWPGDAVHINHLGYRPGDQKIAIVTADPASAAEIRRDSDGAVVFRVPADGGSISSKGRDAQAGENVWQIDFTPFRTTGSYRLRIPALGAESYVFDIGDFVYAPLLRILLRGLYAQRCGTSHPAAYMGEAWADPRPCHPQDQRCRRNTRDQKKGKDYGALDLSGFWHDAGDYNKYIGASGPFNGDDGSTIWFLATAFDLNFSAFKDGVMGIPESGNGIPDVLDEIRWGLNWYLKMQREDGSVLSAVHAPGDDYTSASPPSSDRTLRYYMDATTDSTAIAGACMAAGARLFAGRDPRYAS